MSRCMIRSLCAYSSAWSSLRKYVWSPGRSMQPTRRSCTMASKNSVAIITVPVDGSQSMSSNLSIFGPFFTLTRTSASSFTRSALNLSFLKTLMTTWSFVRFLTAL
eukprot:Amastigsp_a2504_19.p4 type:complete len:106 gc:universal Amastigsp_a2504_19:672-355(-)